MSIIFIFTKKTGRYTKYLKNLYRIKVIIFLFFYLYNIVLSFFRTIYCVAIKKWNKHKIICNLGLGNNSIRLPKKCRRINAIVYNGTFTLRPCRYWNRYYTVGRPDEKSLLVLGKNDFAIVLVSRSNNILC